MSKNEKIKCPECAKRLSYSSIKKHCYNIHNKQYKVICKFCGDEVPTSSIYYHFRNQHEIFGEKDPAMKEEESEEESESEEKERNEKNKIKPRYAKYLSEKKINRLREEKIAKKIPGYKLPEEKAEEESEEDSKKELKLLNKKLKREEKDDEERLMERRIKRHCKNIINKKKTKTLAIVTSDLRVCGISDEEIIKSIDRNIENLICLKKLIQEKKTRRVKNLNENNYLYKYIKTTPIDKNLNINVTFQNIINNYNK